MRERYIAPAIMLIAGAITSILNIVNGVKALDGLKALLIVLIIFYIIGKIVTVIIRKATAVPGVPTETVQTPTEEEELTTEEEISQKGDSTIGERKTEDSSEI
ncbi:hypothetical protein acsn021_27880 [Anaerocolumna cellulosilytica]|uniref:Uncharacterized protein n=1 Tax=Anaerocolumna cellulosilytica TaxID=433286 RepID=A0A6S6R1K7_9FIRM|nr:hypothetical protein [Anaerocolumna cellulosilytica]MBB5197005.1 flagellar biosynthesis/type III secretory pathway M-ring protein FliF/YscJ [Anaerocolumna cellulosilytica]BCJ95219.1 hypothetical protein acsn021_27880 [Anaerocolumna cellulosilytica]